MKRFFSLFCVALLSVALPVVSADDAGAQGQIYVTDAASAAASDVINGRVVSTISVEVDGEMHRATEIEISSAPKGRLSGSVLVETPGGERADGTVMFVSHTPELIPNELVQLALMPAEHHTSAVLPVATSRDLPVYSVAGGSDGAWGLLPDGVGRANAVGDYSLTDSSWPDFAPPVPFNVNYRNSGISESATIEAVKQGFQIWEDDPGSTVEFSYSGETTKVGVNLEDNVNTVSWVTPPAGTGWLAQANWMATTNGEILGFDIRVSRNYNWSNGAASGRYDIATVVAHEVGHGIGLGHGPSSSDLMHALIQQGSAKGLGPGDRSGAAFLYPEPFPPFTGSTTCPDSMPLGSLRAGIAVRDTAPGNGYLLWSDQSVHDRFEPAPYRSNASHLIAVKYSGGVWYYDNNSELTPFTPSSSDCLVASLNFTADTVTSYAGVDTRIGGIDAGYVTGDLVVTANQYDGSTNSGEFGIGGTYVSTEPMIPRFTGATDCPSSMDIGNVRAGVAARDTAPGRGYLLWSDESVHTRFFPRPNSGNADHFIAVKYSTGRWFFDNNSVLTAFVPRSTDCIVATLNFAEDATRVIRNTSGRLGGIDTGFLWGDFDVFADTYNGVTNEGEFWITGSGTLDR